MIIKKYMNKYEWTVTDLLHTRFNASREIELQQKLNSMLMQKSSNMSVMVDFVENTWAVREPVCNSRLKSVEF
jgi:hypothetical protein